MKERKKSDFIMDAVCTFVSFSVIVGLVWCLADSLIGFIIGLLAILLGTELYIIITYFLCRKWKWLKDILSISKRSEKENANKT